MVRKYKINPAYLGKVSMPRMEFLQREYNEILAKLEENKNLDSLTIMLHLGNLEKMLQDRLGDEFFNKSPILLKEIDEEGYIAGYTISGQVMKDLSRPDVQLMHYINRI